MINTITKSNSSKEFSKLLSVLVDQLFMSLSTFSTTIILARTLDILVFADFVLLTTVTVFLVGFQSSMICKPYGINLFDFKDSLGKDFFQFTLNSKLVFSLIIILIFPFAYYLSFEEFDIRNMLIFAVYIISYTFYQFIREILLSQRKTKVNMIYGMICSTSLMVLLFFIWMEDLNSLYLYLLCASLIFFSISLFYYIKNLRFDKIKFSSQLYFFKENWRVGKWLIGGNLLYHLSANFYPWLLLYITDKKDVAILGILLSIASIFSPILKALNSYLLPIFVRIHKDFDKVKSLVKRYVIFFGVISISVLLLGYFLGQDLMVFFFGEKYSALGLLVVMPFLIQAIVILFQPVRIALLAIKRTDVEFWIYIPRSLISVVLGYFFIKEHGIYGAFYSMLVENIFYQVFQLYVFNKIMNKNSKIVH